MNQTLEFNTVDMFHDALNGASKRHQAISDNLANVNTPGYKRKEVSFEESLKEAYLPDTEWCSDLGPEGFGDNSDSRVQPKVHRVDDTSMRNDKNNVDPDREMANLSKNTLYHKGLSRMTQQQFEYLNQLIQTLGRP